MREVSVSHDTLLRLDKKLIELCHQRKAECWHDGSMPFKAFGINTKSKVYTKQYSVYIGSGTVLSIQRIKMTLRFNWNILKGRVDMSAKAWEIFFDKLPELFTELNNNDIIKSDSNHKEMISADSHQL